MKKLYILLLILSISLSAVPMVSAQCAMCKATVESNSKTKDTAVGRGLNKGILYLMTIPYLLVGAVGCLWYVNSKKNRKLSKVSRNIAK